MLIPVCKNAIHGIIYVVSITCRCGRSNRVPMLFMYEHKNQNEVMKEETFKQLKTLPELGSGSKLRRDLSIRGAGKPSFTQQHAFMNSVGFDMYSQCYLDCSKNKEKISKTKTYCWNDLGHWCYFQNVHLQTNDQKIKFINGSSIRKYDITKN